ncbi:class I SAM-dependent methyltransferase [Kaarinaea lacus]
MSCESDVQHKHNVIAVFDTIAPGYDNAALRFFPFCADQIVAVLNSKPGQKVLDVATGTGAVAVALAQAVRPGGRVIGIDLSRAMLSKAEQNIRKMALDNVDLFRMDAESLEFKRNYFDASVCSFGLFFMPQMAKALNELVRVTKSGGTVLFTSFSKNAFQPMRKQMFIDLAEFSVEPANLHLASEKLTGPDECQRLMKQAGLNGVQVQKKQLGYHLQSAEDWWAILWNSGARRLIDQLSDEQRVQFRIKHSATIQKLATDNGIWMDVEVLFSSGRVQ